MVNRLHKLLFLVILGAVLLVFVAPSVDLPDTVLDTQQSLYYVVICITLLISLHFLTVSMVLCRCEREIPALRHLRALSPLLCIFRC